MSNGSLQTLRVRCALAPSLADHRTYNDWHRSGPPIEHIAPFSREIDQVVETQKHEVITRMRYDRALPHGRSANGNAGEGIFHRRGIEYPRWAEAPGRFG